MNVRITQIDGSLPNLALMKLSHWHKSQGHHVYFERSIHRNLFEPEYDKVYGSSIFTTSANKVTMFRQNFPTAIVGGTGSDMTLKVENIIGCGEYEYENYDYEIYPEFDASIGFTQRGCRLNCSFCVVPRKEGKNIGVNKISQIWRGEGHARKIHLLDNDFFGQPAWRDRSEEIINGKFKVCFNQGINVRLIHEEGAYLLSRMLYYDDQFKKRRLYTAWDNRRDEKIFTKGISILINAGIKPGHIMVYMLCGFWKGETFEDVYYRYEYMKKMGLMPYPMVYGENKMLKKFQRWVIRRYDSIVDWNTFSRQTETEYYKMQYGKLPQNLILNLK